MVFRIGIIGAGVAGAAVAAGLRDLPGIQVTCLERTGQSDHVHAGNGLNVGPNALLALERSIPALAEARQSSSLPWTRWQACLADATIIYHTPLESVADRPGVRIRWSELYRILREAAGPDVHYHQHPATIQIETDGTVTVHALSDADTPEPRHWNFDLLIAADGRYSEVRAQLSGEPVPRHLGVSNFRALVDDRGQLDIDDMEQWFNGPRRLICFRLRDGLLYVSGNLPIEAGAPVPEHYPRADFLRSAYTEGTAAPDARLVHLSQSFAAQAEQLHWARAQEIEPLFRDRSGSVIYIGDAAHAMCPTLGQGATMALEDAAALSLLLRAAAGAGGLQAARLSSTFQALRDNRVQFVKQLSWDASDTLLFGADPWSGNLSKSDPQYLEKLRQLYLHTGLDGSLVEYWLQAEESVS
ncbi:MAG: FAD-dependent monooxygenase [Ectothiorhodospiraceae bacterium]|nr:FAD-dependent monooxygenase [Ectothiorhodospiraceae bacterium]